jgi:4-hydroxy-3-methylbut-2-enyl diphosphate reductase
MIRIEIDEKSGFCTGVIKAVKAAEKELKENERLFSLGDLVHNPCEVSRLKKTGLESITYEEFDQMAGDTVLIRAHGEPPSTYEKASRRNIRLIDATCPIVHNLQKKIRDCYSASRGKEACILIFGKSNHPEVRALVGQTEGTAIVVRDPVELSAVELKAPVFLFSQTTMNLAEFYEFHKALRIRMIESGMDPDRDLILHDTVCRQVSSREGRLKEFVGKYDLVFFVSGKKSSNGKALYGICTEVNPNTHFISTPEESDPVGLENISSIGICGATSTPRWLLADVKDRLEKRLNITMG